MYYEVINLIMKSKTSEKIIKLIKTKKQVTARELIGWLDIRERAVFKQLKKLYLEGRIDKIGQPPKVFYFIKKKAKPAAEFTLEAKTKEIIAKNYLIITPGGEKKQGVDGFVYWCQKNNLPIEKTAFEYIKTWQKYAKYKKKGFIDGVYKLQSAFDKVFIDRLYYLDFYSLERFGKTKLGWLLLYAKQSQDRKLIKELVLAFKNKVDFLIKKHKIQAVGFIPPTLQRQVQLMKELERNLGLSLPTILIKKAKTPVVVAQKTLSKLEDRIENARKTIFVSNDKTYSNILLIDDAVGSGATMNETAKKLKENDIIRGKIYGLAIIGSFKSFAVISEV